MTRRCTTSQVETMLNEARRRFGGGGFPVPVLLGILPLVSARNAEFLHNEVPGITIPDAARARMRDAGAGGTEAGIEMADALLATVEGEVAGTYLMPSFGRYEQAAELAPGLRQAPGRAELRIVERPARIVGGCEGRSRRR
jgi:5,10-methylenetetrahydrofolate reductase